MLFFHMHTVFSLLFLSLHSLRFFDTEDITSTRVHGTFYIKVDLGQGVGRRPITLN